MSWVKHSSAGFVKGVEWLPLFDAEQKASDEVLEHNEDCKSRTESILKSYFFDEPIKLTQTYSNPKMKETWSELHFLWVVVDSMWNKGFSIEVDHDFVQEYSKSYTRDWHKKGYKGQRDTFRYNKRHTWKRRYTVFSTWWKSEDKQHIVAYNWKFKRSNSNVSDILVRDSLHPLVMEMIECASRKWLL